MRLGFALLKKELLDRFKIEEAEAQTMITDGQPCLSLEGCWAGKGICNARSLVSLRT
jgi:hypothetical protein